MPNKIFKIVVGLELSSFIFMMIGLFLMLTSCGTKKKITDREHVDITTVTSDTVYVDRIIRVPIKGDSAVASGDHFKIEVRDSINLIDSVVIRYKYRTLDPKEVKINYPPVFAISKYGKAMGEVVDNKLNVELTIYDRVIAHDVDSAVAQVTNTISREVTTTNNSEVVKHKIPYFIWIIMLIMIVVIVIGWKLRHLF